MFIIGIGEAVSALFGEENGVRVKMLCVTGVPRSGPPDMLLDLYGISAKAIIKAVRYFN